MSSENLDIIVRPYKYRRGFLPYHDTFKQYLIPTDNSDNPDKYGKDLTIDELMKFGVKPILLGDDDWHDPSENTANWLMFGGLGTARAFPAIIETANNILPYTTARGLLALRGTSAPSWLTPTSATAIDAALMGSATGASINNMIENGPTVENVFGTAMGAGSLMFEAMPTIMEGYLAGKRFILPYRVARQMNSALETSDVSLMGPFMSKFNFGKGSGFVVRADKGDGLGAFTGQGAYVKDGFLYPGKTRMEGLRDFTWWNEDELFSPGFNTKPYPRVFVARKSDIPGLLRVREMNEPAGQWRPGSRKAFVRQSEMVTPEPIDVTKLTHYNYDPSLGIYVRSDVSTHNISKSGFSEVTPSIGAESANKYVLNGEWNLSKIKEDLLAGKLDFINWIESPAYRAAAEANVKEAESMGLKFVPTYEYPSYQNLKDNGVQIMFVNEPANNAQGWVGTLAESPVTINLAKAKDIRTVTAHEDAHVARHAWLDPNYPELDVKKQQAYLRYKNGLVFLDDLADLSEEAGSRFYDFSSTGFPHEAVTNTRDLGKFYGIEVGLEYPGPEKTLLLLDKMEREAKPGFQKRFIQSFRRDPEHLPYVWKALNGTLWALLLGIAGAASQLDSYKDGGIIKQLRNIE